MDSSHLSTLLNETCSSITQILDEAGKCFSGCNLASNPEEFVNKGYGSLCAVIACYSKLFKISQCRTRTDLETLWASCFSHLIVRDAVEELLVVEDKWDQFLQSVDDFMDKKLLSKNCDTIGVDAITSLLIVNTSDNTVSTMKELINNQTSVASFALLNCNIHVVSFGSCEGALRWKKETNCLFPVWADSGRHLYEALGFKRSMYQVWRIASMIFYGAQLAADTALPQPFTDYIDDPLQMAGNVIFDSNSNIVSIYASQYPADRPAVEDMLQILQNLKE